MGVFLEALILYMILFLTGLDAGGNAGQGETISFSAVMELRRMVFYTLPSLALIWRVLWWHRFREGENSPLPILAKPRRKDLLSGLLGFGVLAALGFAFSLAPALFPQIPAVRIEVPREAAAALVLIVSSIGTGYLEESYFRYYLLTSFSPVGTGKPAAVFSVIFSSILFALCHVYEGPWGTANAFLAGLFLSALFLKYRSLHGIAWAHGAYNILAYFIMMNLYG